MLYFPSNYPNAFEQRTTLYNAPEISDVPAGVPSLKSRVALTCVNHAIRDVGGQVVARIAGLGTYWLLTRLGGTPLRIASGIVGAGVAGRVSYLIASKQIGTDTNIKCVAVGACTVVGSIIGGVITGLGSIQLVSGVAAGSVFTAAASLTATCVANKDDKEKTNQLKAGAAIGATCAGIGVAAYIDDHWMGASDHLFARNIGAIIESITIELWKSASEKLGPSADRNVLNFEGKVVATICGMLPYLLMTVWLNGTVASQLVQDPDMASFSDLAKMLTIGSLPNGVRGAGNALSVTIIEHYGLFVVDENSTSLRNNEGLQPPNPETVINKTCIRHMLSVCRNVIYARLRENHMSVEDASEIAQGVYACFAQCRELIHDIARGEGWSEPKMVQRASIELATA